MPTNARDKTLSLLADIQPADTALLQEVVERCGGLLPARLARLAGQLAGAQRTAKPLVKNKGLVLFAAASGAQSATDSQVCEFLTKPNPLALWAAQQQVKIAVTDVGLSKDMGGAELAGRIFRQRPPVDITDPRERAWECVQSGVRMAYLLRGKQTEIFGGATMTLYHEPAETFEAVVAKEQWELAALAGLILGAASLQTLVVIAGATGCAALALAEGIAPQVTGYVMDASSWDEWLNEGVAFAGEKTGDDLTGVVQGLSHCSYVAQVLKECAHE